MKIKGKLISCFSSVIVLTLLVFGAITYNTFIESTKKSSHEIVRLQSTAVSYKIINRIDKIIENINHEIKAILFGISAGSLSESSSRQLLDSMVVDSPLITSITMTQQSFILAASSKAPPFQSDFLENISAELPESKLPIFHEQADTLLLLWPLDIEDLPGAVMIFSLNRQILEQMIQETMTIKDSILFIASKDLRKNLLGPLYQGKERTLAVPPFEQMQQIASSAIIQTKSLSIYRHDTDLFGAELLLVVPNAFFMENLVFLKNRIITAMLIVGWFSIWVILIIANAISRPIQQLSKLTKDIIAFDYSTKLELKPSSDEVGELAKDFERMRVKIKDLVAKDPLTHVYNRRFLMHIFELDVLKALRMEQELACIMIDIDHFKQVNDQHGHQCGDEVLSVLGRILLEETRNYDTPARYGGEEFIIVLPETSIKEAFSIAERIREEMAATITNFKGIEVQCTLSLGISALEKYSANTTAQIISNADTALYKAKESGRNQTFIYRN